VVELVVEKSVLTAFQVDLPAKRVSVVRTRESFECLARAAPVHARASTCDSDQMEPQSPRAAKGAPTFVHISHFKCDAILMFNVRQVQAPLTRVERIKVKRHKVKERFDC
jgi:hypothetical protein